MKIGKWYHMTELPVRRDKMAHLLVVNFQGRRDFLQGLCIFQPAIHSIILDLTFFQIQITEYKK